MMYELVAGYLLGLATGITLMWLAHKAHCDRYHDHT